ncbi:hypothetical protein D3C80_975320 [compost metagenome]
MHQLVAAGIDDQQLVLQGIEHQAEPPVLGEAQRPHALADRDHLAYFQALAIDDADGAGLAIGHMDRLGQRRPGGRQRLRPRGHIAHMAQPGDIEHAQGAAVAVADEGVPRIVAESDFVKALAGTMIEHLLEGLRVDDGHPALAAISGIVADPQVAPVRLQRHPHRLRPDGHVGQHLEAVGIDHRNLPGIGHRYVQAFVLVAGHPVHGRALERDTAQGAGNAADRDRGVDHGNTRVLVQQQQVVAVEVQQRARVHHALEVQADARLAARLPTVLAGADVRVQPGPRCHAAERLATVGIFDVKAHVGQVAFAQLAIGARRHGFELDGHAVAYHTLALVGRAGLGNRARALPGLAAVEVKPGPGRDGHCYYCQSHAHHGFAFHAVALLVGRTATAPLSAQAHH